jgi:hypothetical protein
MVGMTDRIEIYLDELADRLSGRGRDLRRALAEAEDHLLEGVAAARAEGLSPEAAQARAIERFGSPEEVAHRFAAERGLLVWLWNLALSLGFLAAIGLTAIGASGVVAAVGGRVVGKAFVAGDAPGVTYTKERCAQYFVLKPEAKTCRDAALRHHYDEVVGYRFDAGILGLAGLIGWALIGRRWRRPGVLPEAFVPVAGLATFGGAGVLLSVMGGLDLVFSGTHTGAWSYMSGAVVAAAVALGFLVVLLRRPVVARER